MKLLNRQTKIFTILTALSIAALIAGCIMIHEPALTIALGMASVLGVFAVSFFSHKQLNQIKSHLESDEIVESNHPLLSAIAIQKGKVKELSDFVSKDVSEKFDFQFLSPEDSVVQSLIQIRQEQLRHEEDERRRHWKSEGLAKFGEILRTNDQDLEKISNTILRELVKYIGANQGGLFVAQEEDGQRYMDMLACYAYDRKKFIEKRVEEGQGLLGQVMLEKDMIYITDVPSEFVRITSGLGESTPTNILIVPLILNEEFYGAIEIAAFEMFEAYQKEFLLEVASNIASAIATVKNSEHTQKLLEDSQKLASELSTAEEEMRQNMEELQATQEEMKRKQSEIDGLFGAIDSTQVLIELSLDGELLKANNRLLGLLGCTAENFGNIAYKLYEGTNILKTVGEGAHETREVCIKDCQDEDIWLMANYSPVRNGEGQIYKILILAQDITEKRQKEKEFETLSLVADNTNNSVLITNKDRQVEYVNQGFTRLTGYTLEEMKGKVPGHVLQGADTDQETVARIREKLDKNEPIFEEILNYTKSGESYWISMAINPVTNNAGEVYKYISIQADITDTKSKAMDHKYQLEAINRANAVLEMDMDGTILSINDNFNKIFKYSNEEVIGKKYSLFLPEEEVKSRRHELFWAKMRKGDFVSGEFICLDRLGNEVWLRGIYNPIFDLKGNPKKIIIYANEITQEKKLQIETEAQKRELTSHLETINKTIATIEFDENSQITNVNNVYLDISGYSLEELVGKTYDYVLPPSEITKPQHEMMWMSLKSGNHFTGQFRQKSKTGKDLWLLGTFNPVMNDDGGLESIKMFAQFNTLEKEKQINMNQMLSAFKSIVPVVELDEDGQCVRANDIFHQRLGIGKLDLRNKSIDEVFETDFKREQIKKIITKLKKGQVIEELVSFVSDEGAIKLYRAIFNPIKKQDDQLSRVLLVLIDKELIINMSTST